MIAILSIVTYGMLQHCDAVGSLFMICMHYPTTASFDTVSSLYMMYMHYLFA